MPIEKNLTARIDSVKNLAGHWSRTMPKKPGKRGENGKQRDWDGLIHLLQEFSDFAKGYAQVLADAPVLNQRFVVNAAMDRLLHNFYTLSRACEQRRGLVTKDSLAYFLAQAEDVLEGYCGQWLASDQAYVALKTPVVY
ncbi:MAG: hypothetical protein AB1649_06100, partial [Chloroflexota bacterium]